MIRLLALGASLVLVFGVACSSSPTAPTPTDAFEITSQPQSQSVDTGASVTLRVSANGSSTFHYQWYVGESGTTSAPIPDAVSPTYTTPPLTNTTTYWVRITGETRSIDSATATIAVTPTATTGTPPTITSQPQRGTLRAGEMAILRVRASGAGPLRYQWYEGTRGGTSSPHVGATSTDWETPPLTETTMFWVRVSNAAGSVDSATATLAVADAPAGGAPPPTGTVPRITTEPEDQNLQSGQVAQLDVRSTGAEPLSYQWYTGRSGRTSSPIQGATSRRFTSEPLTETTNYWVRVSNAHGRDDSATARVTVTSSGSSPEPSPPPSPSVDTSAALEQQVLTLVNQHRAAGATCGGTSYPSVGALSMNGSLRSAARNHSADMATNNYFSHTSQDGRSFSDRIWEAGYSGEVPLGENIAAGMSTAPAVVNSWMNSSGHCRNIMNTGFKDIGVGYAFVAGSTYGRYWTQSFGGG